MSKIFEGLDKAASRQIQNIVRQNPKGSADEKMLLKRYIMTPMVQDFNLSPEEWIGQATKWLAVNQNNIKKNYPEVDTSDLIDLASKMYEDFLAMQGQLEEARWKGRIAGGLAGGPLGAILGDQLQKYIDDPEFRQKVDQAFGIDKLKGTNQPAQQVADPEKKSGRTLSQTPDAIRKREQRAAAKAAQSTDKPATEKPRARVNQQTGALEPVQTDTPKTTKPKTTRTPKVTPPKSSLPSLDAEPGRTIGGGYQDMRWHKAPLPGAADAVDDVVKVASKTPIGRKLGALGAAAGIVGGAGSAMYSGIEDKFRDLLGAEDDKPAPNKVERLPRNVRGVQTRINKHKARDVAADDPDLGALYRRAAGLEPGSMVGEPPESQTPPPQSSQPAVEPESDILGAPGADTAERTGPLDGPTGGTPPIGTSSEPDILGAPGADVSEPNTPIDRNRSRPRRPSEIYSQPEIFEAPLDAADLVKNIPPSAKAGAKTLGKLGAKAIPFVGVPLAAVDAAERYKQKDYPGAAISGAASVAYGIPGLGQWVGGGLDALNYARDSGIDKYVPKTAIGRGIKEAGKSKQFQHNDIDKEVMANLWPEETTGSRYVVYTSSGLTIDENDLDTAIVYAQEIANRNLDSDATVYDKIRKMPVKSYRGKEEVAIDQNRLHEGDVIVGPWKGSSANPPSEPQQPSVPVLKGKKIQAQKITQQQPSKFDQLSLTVMKVIEKGGPIANDDPESDIEDALIKIGQRPTTLLISKIWDVMKNTGFAEEMGYEEEAMEGYSAGAVGGIGLGEGNTPPKAGFNKNPHKVGPGTSKDDYEYKKFIPRDRKEKGEEWAIARDVRNVNSKLGKKKPKELDTGFYKNYLGNRPVREEEIDEAGGRLGAINTVTQLFKSIAKGGDPVDMNIQQRQMNALMRKYNIDYKDIGVQKPTPPAQKPTQQPSSEPGQYKSWIDTLPTFDDPAKGSNYKKWEPDPIEENDMDEGIGNVVKGGTKRIATMRKYFAGDETAKDPTDSSIQRAWFADPKNQSQLQPKVNKPQQTKTPLLTPEDKLDELSPKTINAFLDKASAAVRGGRPEPAKINPVTKQTAPPGWKVAAGKVAKPGTAMDHYAKVKAIEPKVPVKEYDANLINQIAAANKIKNPDRIYPGQKITLPSGDVYTVRKGDTLSDIASAAKNIRPAVTMEPMQTVTITSPRISNRYPDSGSPPGQAFSDPRNNPGNLRGTDALRKPGYVLDKAVGFDKKGFAIFANPEDGKEAMRRQLALDALKRGLTGRQLINKYAPPSDNNDTDAYIKNTFGELGLDPDSKINPEDLGRIQRLMVRQEHGKQGMQHYFPDVPTNNMIAQVNEMEILQKFLDKDNDKDKQDKPVANPNAVYKKPGAPKSAPHDISQPEEPVEIPGHPLERDRPKLDAEVQKRLQQLQPQKTKESSILKGIKGHKS